MYLFLHLILKNLFFNYFLLFESTNKVVNVIPFDIVIVDEFEIVTSTDNELISQVLVV
jgi:hypothetical protein